MIKFFLQKVENFIGKDKADGYVHFLLFPLCFQKLSSSWLLQLKIVW